MKTTEIIKDAFLFPSKNTGRFAIYLLLSVLMVGFALGGVFTYAFGFIDAENYLAGGIYLIIAMLIGLIITGYHIQVIKSGIEHDDNVPVFELYENFMTGFDNFIVSIIYFIIPTLIVMLVGLDTNLFGNAIAVVKEFVLQIFNVYIMGNPIDTAINAISLALINLLNSLAITITVALILFVIFSFFQTMAEARLANTGSLSEALNVFEAAKDISRIGVGKVIILILLVIIIAAVVEMVFSAVFSIVPILAILSVVITPYLAFFANRAIGLLYSDIA